VKPFSCTQFFFFLMITAAFLLPAQAEGQGRRRGDIQGDSFEEVSGRGLVIRTDPAQAKVYIDGIDRGLSPLTLGNLDRGEYSVRIYKEGYTERRFPVTLHSSSRLVVSIELLEEKGQVLINGSLPAGALIYADGEVVDGPLLTLPEGNHTIKIRAFGYDEAEERIYVRGGQTAYINAVPKASVFRISLSSQRRSRFNPANSGTLGTTTLNFEVSGPGAAVMTVRDSAGTPVFTKDLGTFNDWSQSADWSGLDSAGQALSDGAYTIGIEAAGLSGESAPQTINAQVTIDSSITIYPLSVPAAIAGLLYAPSPGVLPRGSFQIEGGLRFGSVSEEGSAFSSLPFEVDLRLSPVSRLEFGAGFSAVPVFGKGAVWGVAFSSKWLVLSSGGNNPFELAAGLSYAWSANPSFNPFDEGISLYLPMSYGLGLFTFILSPGIRWIVPGEKSPRLIIPSGVLYRLPNVILGLSAKPEFNFNSLSNDDSYLFTFKAGAEVKWNPPPSNLVYTLLGGVWTGNGRTGAYGGVGIGVIY
jgi:hypothetical protein